MSLKLCVVEFHKRNARHSENGVEALQFGFHLLFFHILFCACHLADIGEFAEIVVLIIALRFLCEVVENVFCDKCDSLRVFENLVLVDGRHRFLLDFVVGAQRADIIHTEWQHIAVANGIHNGVAVQAVAKSALGGGEFHIAYGTGVVGEYRCACEAEHVVFLEFLHNGLVHIAKLRAVALVENHHHVLVVNLVQRVS